MRRAQLIISTVLALVFWIILYKYEYDGGVYADATGTSGNIAQGWSIPLLLAALLFTVLAIRAGSKSKVQK